MVAFGSLERRFLALIMTRALWTTVAGMGTFNSLVSTHPREALVIEVTQQAFSTSSLRCGMQERVHSFTRQIHGYVVLVDA